MTPPNIERFVSPLFQALDETFTKVGGMYLDRGTSLFETLATISAAQASIPVSTSCASIAAQVEHVRFYLDTLERYLKNEEVSGVDWGEVWRTVSIVTPDEWEASKTRLKASYERVLAIMKSFDSWENEDSFGNALAILVHTAYHLGEIRQALCTIQPDGS